MVPAGAGILRLCRLDNGIPRSLLGGGRHEYKQLRPTSDQVLQMSSRYVSRPDNVTCCVKVPVDTELFEALADHVALT